MTAHLFVDESFRSGRYLLTAAVVPPNRLRPLRTLVRSMLLPGQRELHMKLESARRRRMVLDRLVAAQVQARVYAAGCHERRQEAARAECLRRLLLDAVEEGAQRLVLDTRGPRDTHDVRTLQAAIGTRPSKSLLTYEHLDSTHEALIGLADFLGWAHGAGGEWRRRASPAISAVIDCT